MKIISKVFSAVIALGVTVVMLLVVAVCVLTPEKTKHRTYTDVYKYWTDEVYVCENFECTTKKGA